MTERVTMWAATNYSSYITGGYTTSLILQHIEGNVLEKESHFLSGGYLSRLLYCLFCGLSPDSCFSSLSFCLDNLANGSRNGARIRYL